MQCLQKVFYSQLSLQKHRVSLKGQQSNPQTVRLKEVYHNGTTPPVLKFLDLPLNFPLLIQLS